MNASEYKQVLRLYEIDREKARGLYERRKAEVYSRLPRVAALDDELTQLSLNAARGLLNGGADTVLIKQRIHAIFEEKRVLMEQAGVSGDYLTNVYTCQYCKDTGYISTQKCHCLKQRIIDRHYRVAGLGEAMDEENFQSFEFKYYSNEIDPNLGLSPYLNIRKVYDCCLDFVLNFNTEFDNLLLYGEPGLGKTFLCNCIARDLLYAGFGVLYVTAPMLFKKIEDFRFNHNEQETSERQIELVYNAELLIIDDLGSEFPTIVTDTALFNIINSRLLIRRPTVISTNLSLSDLQNAYTDRIYSRIAGNYDMLRLFGDDIRFKKKKMVRGE